MQKVLEDADLKKEDIDEIVLVGGSTRIVKIQQLVRDYFNGKVHVMFLSCYVYLLLKQHESEVSTVILLTQCQQVLKVIGEYYYYYYYYYY